MAAVTTQPHLSAQQSRAAILVAHGHFLRVLTATWLDLLDHYARDPMGGGVGLSAYARTHLVDELKRLPTFHGALAWRGEKVVGLINCFAGFSTFAAKPLLNIHDIVVHADARRQGIGQALFERLVYDAEGNNPDSPINTLGDAASRDAWHERTGRRRHRFRCG